MCAASIHKSTRILQPSELLLKSTPQLRSPSKMGSRQSRGDSSLTDRLKTPASSPEPQPAHILSTFNPRNFVLICIIPLPIFSFATLHIVFLGSLYSFQVSEICGEPRLLVMAGGRPPREQSSRQRSIAVSGRGMPNVERSCTQSGANSPKSLFWKTLRLKCPVFNHLRVPLSQLTGLYSRLYLCSGFFSKVQHV